MLGERRPRRIRHADKRALRSGHIHLIQNRRPHQALGWVVRRAGFALDAHDRAHDRIHGRPVTTEQNHRRRAVAGDVSARSINDMGQVQARQHLFDQLGTELALHEAVGGDQPDKSGVALALTPTLSRREREWREGQFKEALGERATQRILAVATDIALPVGLIQRRILHRDVGRITDHRVVLPAQNPLHLGQVFAGVGMGQPRVGVVLGLLEHLLGVLQAEPRTVQQAVANRHVQPQVGRIRQPPHFAHPQRRRQQPEPGDGHRKGVQVHARHPIQRLLRDVARIAARFVTQPLGGQPLEPAEQKVAGAAGRIEHPHLAESELPNRRGQRPVEDQRLHKFRRLQQRITLAGRLGQVLIQIAEKAGIPGRVGEIVDQRAGVGINGLPELAQRHRRITADAEPEHRIVRFIEKGGEPRQPARFPKGGQQILAVGLQRLGAEIGLVPVARQRQPARFGRARQPGALDQRVVFDEAQKHAG